MYVACFKQVIVQRQSFLYKSTPILLLLLADCEVRQIITIYINTQIAHGKADVNSIWYNACQTVWFAQRALGSRRMYKKCIHPI